jgi:acyl-CoA reductase-like NAD-dependent aldehyde dehydrogenase
VIADPRPDAEVVRDEVFGPVCVVEAYGAFADALARANGTRYGLQASIFTADLGRALEAARGLEFGGVLVNEAPTFRTDQMPYGGVKESGNTREGPRYAMREFTEERLVVLELPGG